MLKILRALFSSFRSAFKTHRDLALENLALRHQLTVLKRQTKKPKLTPADRLFWVSLLKWWRGWKPSLLIVQPDTVVRWHRLGFKRYWTRLSRSGPGRPPTNTEVRELIWKMAFANPLWGAPRIHAELRYLGIHDVSERTVSRLMPRRQKPPSQTWRTFLTNQSLVSIDFFTVPTATFRVLFGFLVLSHDRRRILHFNVTEHPTAEWTAQQLVDAFPWETAPKYLVRDRDAVFGPDFRERIRRLGIEDTPIAPRSPWQSPYVERLIGSIRRECLDHVIVLNEKHLLRILRSYVDYYHRARTHLGLKKQCPLHRPVQSPPMGEVVEFPEVGGLHHRYERRAA
jgi:transposase InsO family protein